VPHTGRARRPHPKFQDTPRVSQPPRCECVAPGHGGRRR
jgi:hypothetical protein